MTKWNLFTCIFALYHLFLSILQQGMITLTTSGNEKDTLILKQCSKVRTWSKYSNRPAALKLTRLAVKRKDSAAALWSLKMRENKNKPLRARTVTKLRGLRQRRRRTATRTTKRQTGWIKKNFARASRCFVPFFAFAVVAQPQRETA